MKPGRSRKAEVLQVERAYGELKAWILDGRLRPGAPLSEVTLARTLGTSRTPVREVLSRLRQDGWVERVPSRGYFVARVTLRSIQDAFEVRRLLEGAAAAAAAKQADDGEIERLGQLADLDRQRGAAGAGDAGAANRAFHLAVAEASHNHLASELIARCMAQMDRVLALGVSALPLQRGTNDEHRSIVDAIARHDADGARLAMEDHLDRCAQLLREALFRHPVDGISA
jgi:GntR family transcriptional regulator, rspAB operon transcriptional repressor